MTLVNLCYYRQYPLLYVAVQVVGEVALFIGQGEVFSMALLSKISSEVILKVLNYANESCRPCTCENSEHNFNRNKR